MANTSQYDRNYQLQHRGLWRWVVGTGALLLIAFLISATAHFDSERNGARSVLRTADRQDEPQGEHTSQPPHTLAPKAALATHPALQSVDELFNITGVNDLVGRQVEFELDAVNHPSMLGAPAKFWIAGPDNKRMLVVLKRDKRTEAQEIEGEPPIHGIARLEPGVKYSVRGVIERLPRAEQMYSWEISRGDLSALADRPVYIRADTVQPIG